MTDLCDLVLQILPNKSDLFYLSQAFEDCLILDGLLEKHNNDFGLYRIVYNKYCYF